MRHVKSKALSSGLIKRKGSIAPNAVLLDPTDLVPLWTLATQGFLAAPTSDHFPGSSAPPAGFVGRLKVSRPHFSMPLNECWSWR